MVICGEHAFIVKAHNTSQKESYADHKTVQTTELETERERIYDVPKWTKMMMPKTSKASRTFWMFYTLLPTVEVPSKICTLLSSNLSTDI